MSGPNDVNSLMGVSNERREGAQEEYNPLALNMTDDEIIFAIDTRLTKAAAFWNDKYNLDKVREVNESYWKGQYMDASKLYDFQVPYKNPRIFIDIETLLPMTLANMPEPIVVEDEDSEVSKELAQNVGNSLRATYEDQELKNKFIMVGRHLLVGHRLGVMKYREDDEGGPMVKNDKGEWVRAGDCEVTVPRPSAIVLDQAAKDPNDVPLIGEYLKDTVESLCQKFPKKKDEIWKELGIQRGTASQMYKLVDYIETWFTYYDAGVKKEAVCWKFNKTIMDSMKNPNWNYDEYTTDDNGNRASLNLFDRPKKPYVFFNWLNLGNYVIDDISLSEQSQTLQDVHDKRGRQIVENADMANSGTIFNSDMISTETVSKIIGDPGEKVMVKGNVLEAATRLPSTLLPDYVLSDKLDARAQIDDIFGTHAPVKGNDTSSKTLGQEVMSQRSDLTRNMPLTTSIERGAVQLYKGIVQIRKVFTNYPVDLTYTTSGGQTQHLENFSQDSIKPGIKIRIKEGSMLPQDPMAIMQLTLKAMPVLDPLTMGEGLKGQKLPEPKEFAKRLCLYRMAPDKYYTEIVGESLDQNADAQDPSATQEQQLMASGRPDVPPQVTPTKAHLSTHQAFLASPQFKQLPPEVQKMVIEHVRTEMANIKKALGQPQDQQPTGNQPPTNGQPGQVTEQAPTQTLPQQPQQQPGLLSRLLGGNR